jgi:hypothetical protein
MTTINNFNQNVSFGKAHTKAKDTHKKTDLKTQAINIAKNPAVQVGAGALATVAAGATVYKFHKPTNNLVKPVITSGLEKLNSLKIQVVDKFNSIFNKSKVELSKAEPVIEALSYDI